jgi:hypothetical protein
MRKPMKLLPCLAAAIAVGAFAAPTASAATEVGNNCVANASTAGGLTFLQLAKSTGTPPITAPAAGVVTKWSVNVIPFPSSVGETLKVFRAAADPLQFQLVGESAVGNIVSGLNNFETRIPVQAGDRFGITGAAIGTLYCNTGSPVDKMGFAEGNIPPGGTAAFKEKEGAQAAVSAVIEPDADKDGFGDETQDKCPQSASVQAVACPVLFLDAVTQAPGKSAVRILVASSSDSSITVSASAKLPAKAKKAGASAQAKLAPISQLVTPGKIAVYTLNYNKALKDALKALPRNKSLKLEVAAVGKSLAGADSSDKLTVKLKGQAKP